MLTMIDLYIYKRNTHNDLYIHKRNADNDWLHLKEKCWQWLICTFIREMLTMIELYIYKRNAHNDWFIREMLNDWTVHL